MTFLAPFAWTTLALALPIIALYLIKTRLRRRAVTTLLFWEQLQPPVYSNSLWRKLRRWLSLLLQIVFLALLAFALARPLARWESAGGQGTVIVLDPSPSMLATDVLPDRWTLAWREARRRVKALRFTDQTAIILAGEPPRVLCAWTGNRRALLTALDGVKDAPKRASGEGINEALALAHRLAGTRAGGRIVLFSDGAWSHPPEATALAGVETVYEGSDAPVNNAIVAFSARRSLASPGDFLVTAEVRRFAKTPADGELEVTRDGHLLDLQPVHLEPGKPWTKSWTGHADEATTFAAHLRAPAPDQLAADDNAEAALAAVAPVTVDIVAPPNGFLDAAVGALPATKGRHRRADEPAPDGVAGLTLFYRANPPEGFPADAAVLLIDPPGKGFWGEAGETIEHPLVSDFEKNSVPLRFVGLDSVSLQAAREFRPAAGAEVFVQSFGKPLVFGRWPGAASGGGGRRWLVLAFDLEDTDFALRTAFPVLLANLVQSLRVEQPPVFRTLPGEVKSRLTRTALVGAGQGQKAVTVVSPVVAAAWWARAPLWWWATAVGGGWLLVEWWSFSRRITE